MTAATLTPVRWTPGRFTGRTRLLWVTPAQRGVLESLCEGKSTELVGADWGITDNTVKTHVRDLLDASGARDRVELVSLVHTGALRVWVKPVDGQVSRMPCAGRNRTITGTLGHARSYPPAS